jgi:hypothetical protein
MRRHAEASTGGRNGSAAARTGTTATTAPRPRQRRCPRTSSLIAAAATPSAASSWSCGPAATATRLATSGCVRSCAGCKNSSSPTTATTRAGATGTQPAPLPCADAQTHGPRPRHAARHDCGTHRSTQRARRPRPRQCQRQCQRQRLPQRRQPSGHRPAAGAVTRRAVGRADGTLPARLCHRRAAHAARTDPRHRAHQVGLGARQRRTRTARPRDGAGHRRSRAPRRRRRVRRPVSAVGVADRLWRAQPHERQRGGGPAGHARAGARTLRLHAGAPGRRREPRPGGRRRGALRDAHRRGAAGQVAPAAGPGRPARGALLRPLADATGGFGWHCVRGVEPDTAGPHGTADTPSPGPLADEADPHLGHPGHPQQLLWPLRR